MKSFIQEGDTIDHIAGADIASDDVVVLGNRIGVACADILNGASGSVKVKGVFKLPKTDAQSWAVYDEVFYDSGTGLLTNATGAGKIHAGFCVIAAGSSDAEGYIMLSEPAKRAATIAAVATADGSDAATTQALANALKASHNDLIAKLKAAGIVLNA